MKLEEFLASFSDAKSARDSAMDKVKSALEELSAAESQVDQVLSLFENVEYDESNYDYPSLTDGSLLTELFRPARAMDKLFGGIFGDLF
jgi:hypothetical protein